MTLCLARRLFLHQAVRGLVAVKVGLIWPRSLIAQVKASQIWPSNWFQETPLDQALKAVFDERKIRVSDQIQIDMPPGAENGAIVAITIKTALPNVRSISVFGEKNPVPLIGQFRFMQQGQGHYLRTRIKLAESSSVLVVVESEQTLFSAQQHIEVLKGGCD